MLPFVVPAGTTAVRVRYCHDQPEAPTNARIKHVLDLGPVTRRARRSGAPWAEPEFRGWGGSSHPDVTVSRNGFSSEAAVPREPEAPPPGPDDARLPCPARSRPASGRSSSASRRSPRRPRATPTARSPGASRSTSATDPLWESDPYVPAPYDATPARPAPGWYAGDFHVHAEHSSLGDATMSETFDYAFRPAARRAAPGSTSSRCRTT